MNNLNHSRALAARLFATALLLPALIAGLGLIPAGLVTAQTFTVVHSFSAASGVFPNVTNSDGAFPTDGVVLSGNTLYGTALFGGGSAYGTMYAVNTDGTRFTNFHSFTNFPSDGALPYAGLLSWGNSLYGTTSSGGNPGWGTVFAINTDGTGLTILHNFTALSGAYSNYTNSDGAVPYGYGGLIISGNSLYGTANIGGGSDYGTVFKVNTDGTGFTNLHSFTAGSGAYPTVTNSDGANPLAGLILSGNTLYGTARTGGSSGAGTVFAINTDGTGFATLHSFTGSDGVAPFAGLRLSGSTLYGTASGGGSSSNGTVFKVNTDGTGFTTLHSFTSGSGSNATVTNSDGACPHARLLLLGNTLYGTASGGGSSGNGTVFAVNTDGTGFTTLHSFTGGSGSYPTVTNSDGANPVAGLILSGNTLYGTARSGGSSGMGTVFSLFIPPQLTITPSGTNLILMWPTNYAEVVIQEGHYEAYFLYSTMSLVSPVVWTFVNSTPVVVNGQLVVTNTIDETQRFYRLVKVTGPLSDIPCLWAGPNPCPCRFHCVVPTGGTLGVWSSFANCRDCPGIF